LYAISLSHTISGALIKDASKLETTPPAKSINVSKDASKLKRTSTDNGISLTFNNDGSAQWKDLTGKNLGRSVAMVIDDQVYSAPTVRNEIANGSCMITGNFTEQEIKNLVAIL